LLVEQFVQLILDHELALDRSAPRETPLVAEVTQRLQFRQSLGGGGRRGGRALAVGADTPHRDPGGVTHDLSCSFLPCCMCLKPTRNRVGHAGEAASGVAWSARVTLHTRHSHGRREWEEKA